MSTLFCSNLTSNYKIVRASVASVPSTFLRTFYKRALLLLLVDVNQASARENLQPIRLMVLTF